MAGFALGLNRALLPWKRAGVDYLLCEDAAHVAALRTLSRPASASPRATTSQTWGTKAPGRPAAPAHEAAPASSISPDRGMPAQQPPKAAACTASPRNMPEAAPPRQTAPCANGAVRTPPIPRPLVLPLERWPDAWKQLLGKTVRTPLLLWSYPELRDDLSGHSSRERSNALRRLFADLKLPKGSHAFWPFAPLYGAQDDALPGTACDSQFFHSGVHMLRPRTVLLLCEQFPEALKLPQIGVMQSIIYKGVRFVRLHGLEHLAEDMVQHPSRHTQLVQFLRTLCQ